MTMFESVPTPLQLPRKYGVYTGVETELGGADDVSVAVQLGLEAPRFCGQCGRRMIVQIVPDGWLARCSRHGVATSSDLEVER